MISYCSSQFNFDNFLINMLYFYHIQIYVHTDYFLWIKIILALKTIDCCPYSKN